MLDKEQFLNRTAARFRGKTAYHRGFSQREADIAEFVYDELIVDIVEYMKEGMERIWYSVFYPEEESNAETGDLHRE